MIDDFRQAMQADGLEPPEHIKPGFNRFPGIGKSNGTDAWCILFADGQGGSFGDWSQPGLKGEWQAHRERPLTKAEREAFRRQVEESRRQVEEQRQQEQQQVAAKALEILRGAVGDPTGHRYAGTKKAPFGPLVKRGPWCQRGWNDALLVPLFDESGQIVSVQAINENPNDKKDFLCGGRKKGCFHPLGKFRGATGRVLIGEGLATVAAAVPATGLPGVVAFDVGNLLPVAEVVRRLAPEAAIVILADDDQEPDKTGNPGIESSTKTALAVGGVVALPALDKKADFWDLLNERGADAVLEAIEAAALVADQQRDQEVTPAGGQGGGATAEELEIETQDWPVMDQAAFHGLAGDFVRLACQNSEADPAAVLATFLVRFGVECGRAPTLYVGDTKHHPRLAAVVVGASSKARKGTSAKPVSRLFSDMEWLAHSSPGPFSSGEGIIYAVRDEVQRVDEKNGEMVTVDPGVLDKRLFVMDEEFAGALASTKREGNTLSMVIRCAWDDGTFDPLTKTNKIKATKAHVGWVSHITIDELHRKLGESEAFNGFANRILWVCARRSKLNPFPQPMPDDELAAVRQRLIAALEPTRGIEFLQMRWSTEARAAWSSGHYQRLTQDQPGLIGCVVNRAEAQAVRLAMVYSLLDGGTVIEEIHLNAALAFWDYCERSARYVFHGRMEDTTAQTILEAVRERDLTGADVHALFGNNLSKARLSDALSCLIAAGRITKETIKQGKGRPTTAYRFRQTPYEKNEKNELIQTSQEPEPVNSLNSLNSYVSVGKSATIPPDTGGGDSVTIMRGPVVENGWLDVQMNVPGCGMKSGPVTVEI